jgi:hypothetical protein
LQNPQTNKSAKGYQAYLTSQKPSSHFRKKTSLVGNKNDKFGVKPLIGSKSAAKLGKLNQRSESAFEMQNKESRQSLNTLSTEAKYLTKPVNRRQVDKPCYMTKSTLSKPLETSNKYSNNSNFKTSGILTTRTISKPNIESKPQLSDKKYRPREYEYKLDTAGCHQDRITYKKLRTKSKGEIKPLKESSTNSSKTSLKCPSSISKSTSRQKGKQSCPKHSKKKSAAIPTRSTKALYANKSDYEKKRNSKASNPQQKTNFSSSEINGRLSASTGYKHLDKGIRYPTGQHDGSGMKSCREISKSVKHTKILFLEHPHTLIEFKLNDEESVENTDQSKNFEKDIKYTLTHSSGSIKLKSTEMSKMHHIKSEQKLDNIKSK